MRLAATLCVAACTLIAASAAHAQTVVPRGDAGAGKAIIEGAGGCLTCHAVDARGGNIGPDLSWIGLLRTPESLRISLVDPDARLPRRYFTVVVDTPDGRRAEGLAINEDDLSIQIRDLEGTLRSFLKSDVKELRREHRSLMPSYASRFSPADIDNVVAYLRTRKTLWPLQSDNSSRAIAPATENASFLDRTDRDRDESPESLLAALDIPAGATIADIGSGTGYFTWRLAQRVGDRGKIFAVDVQQTMLDLTRAAVASRKLENVEYVLAASNDPRLPDRSIDLAFIAYAYHEFADPRAILAAIRRALKPGGRMFILEYAKESDMAPASPLHTMSFDEIRREIEPMGFVVDRLFDFLPVQHGVVFTVSR